jgi:hypothetical protein
MRAFAVTALAAACAILAGVLSGCGSAGSTVDPVAKAAVVSTSTQGYKLGVSMRVTSSSLPAPITATGSGSFNTPARSGSFALTLNLSSIPQLGQLLGGSGTFRIEEVVSGTTVYVKLPASITSKSAVFAGKPWIKLDLAKAGTAAGIPGLSSLLSNPASTDPSQFLRYLRATGGSVTTVGSETVNGVQTTHYRATIDLGRVPDAYPPASRTAARQAIAALERTTGLHQIPVDAWIDSQHLVRRMRFSIPETVSGSGSLTAAVTIEIPEYGPQPAPAVPPASQVTDLSSLAGSSGGLLG